jgi:hypothetical protein
MPRLRSKSLELLPEPVAAVSALGPAPYRPFPAELLPAALGKFVREQARAMGCDAAHYALPALAAAASVIGASRVLRLGPGWEEPCVVWSAVVVDARTRSSTAVRKAVWPLVRIQRQRAQEYRYDLAQYPRRLREYERSRPVIDVGQSLYREPPQPPVLERRICCDTAVEALVQILRDNPRGTLVYRDELDGWLLTLARPRGRNAGRDRAGWPELYQAGVLSVERGPGEARHAFVPRAAASLTGTLGTRALARALASDAAGAGITARLLLAMPPPLRPAAAAEGGSDLGAVTEYHDLLVALRRGVRFAGETPDLEPGTPELSPEAQAARAVCDATERRETGDERLAAALAELEGYAARFALIHHVVERVSRCEDDLVPVGRDSVEAGAAVARWFADETRRIYTVVLESAREYEGRRLAELIRQRGGCISVRELMRRHGYRYRDAATAEAALGELVDRGLARWVVEGAENGR